VILDLIRRLFALNNLLYRLQSRVRMGWFYVDSVSLLFVIH
jgi:hypothetical protein